MVLVSPALPPRRILCLWFPYLPTDRVERRSCSTPCGRLEANAGSSGALQAAPLALVAREKGALSIAAVNRAARAGGIRPGLTLAAARAMLPALASLDHDPDADQALLEAIGDWADRYTPLVGRQPPDVLLLDVTGATHLQGGEAPLLADLHARLRKQGFTVRAALAGTPGAAHALARFAARDRPDGILIERDADLPAALAPLPVAALRIGEETAAGLARVGLKRIGDLLHRPRAPLAARFGPRLLQRLDQALGREEEAITPRQPIPPALVEMTLAEPIVREEDVLAAAGHLAQRLAALLIERGRGARAVRLTVFRVDGAVRRIEAGFAAPCRDAGTMTDLLRHRLAALSDGLDAGFGFDLVRLAAMEVTGMEVEAPPIAGLAPAGDQDGGHDLERRMGALVERLSACLGAERVLRFTGEDSHDPVRAGRLAPALRCPPAMPLPQHERPRPLRLFATPEPVEVMAEVPDGPPLRFRWRRMLHRVAAAEGPERIGPEWWRVAPGSRTRDYYRVEDDTGRRFWLYREGLYERQESSPPRWFVHGLFA